MFAFNLCTVETYLKNIYICMTGVQARKPKSVLTSCATHLIKATSRNLLKCESSKAMRQATFASSAKLQLCSKLTNALISFTSIKKLLCELVKFYGYKESRM